MDDEDVWFEPKRFGYGSGLPVRWQGWALLASYFAALAVSAAVLVVRHTNWFIFVTVLLTLAMTAIAAQHTRGGWRWRWGGE